MEAGAYLNQPYLYQVDGVFSHNPLHDLESLWWVGVWFLLCHYEPSELEDITVQQHIKVVKQFCETLFNNRIDPLSRRRAVIGSALLVNTEPQTFPRAVQHLVVMLDEFREQLVTYYENYKPKESQDRTFFIPHVHLNFDDVFKEALKELENDESGLWPLDDIEKRIAYLNTKK